MHRSETPFLEHRISFVAPGVCHIMGVCSIDVLLVYPFKEKFDVERLAYFLPCFVAVLTPIEEVDLVIAMCAVSGQLNKTFTLMKDTIKSIVDKYGTSKIHYSVVIYGTQAVPMLGFPSRAVTKEDIKKSINILPKPRGKLFHSLNPKINMHFLYTILHTLPSVLMGRICCTISLFILIAIMFDLTLMVEKLRSNRQRI